MTLSSPWQRVGAWMFIAFAAGAALWWLGPVLAPFVVAAVLAYALTPAVDRMDAWFRGRMPRVVAVVVVECLFLLLAASVLLLIVPVLAKEIPLVRDQLPPLIDALAGWLQPLLAQFGLQPRLGLGELKSLIMKYLDTNGDEVLRSVLSSLRIGGSVALAVIGNLVLVPVALFYLLLDWERFVGMLLELVPPRLRGAVDSFLHEADDVLGQYLRGQLLVVLVLAVYYTAGLGLFGLQLALPIGVFTGLAIAVPYLGFGVGLVLALLAGLLQFASAKALVMVAVVYGIGQLVESFYLTPRLVGERIGLHPLAVIFALLAFGQLFGFVGILVALPASAVLLVAIRRLRKGYLSSRLYGDPHSRDRT